MINNNKLFQIEEVSKMLSFYLIFRCRFVLESPRWLIVRGRKKEAGKVFAKMAKVNGYNWNTSTQTFIQVSTEHDSLGMFKNTIIVMLQEIAFLVKRIVCKLSQYTLRNWSYNNK